MNADQVKHGLATSSAELKYSSFHRYVKEGKYHSHWAAKDIVVFNGAVGPGNSERNRENA
jgi:hypothetical protein